MSVRVTTPGMFITVQQALYSRENRTLVISVPNCYQGLKRECTGECTGCVLQKEHRWVGAFIHPMVEKGRPSRHRTIAITPFYPKPDSQASGYFTTNPRSHHTITVTMTRVYTSPLPNLVKNNINIS